MEMESGHPNINVSFKSFDSRVAAILIYGAGIWRYEPRSLGAK